MTKIQAAIGCVIAGIVVGVLVAVVLNRSNDLSGVYNQVTNEFSAGIKVGPNPTLIQQINKGSTSLTVGGGANWQHTASTTRLYPLSTPGVKSGDSVWASFSTSTAGTFSGQGWIILAAIASSTSDYTDLLVLNLGPTDNITRGGIGSTTVWRSER